MPKSKALTVRQHEVLDFICEFRIERSMAPTLQEIADAFDFSTKAADDHVAALVRKGYVASEPAKPRTIRVLRMASIFYGSVGDLFLQVAPKGTAKLK